MKINVELDENDFVKVLAAVGVAYHRREHCGDTEGKRELSELDKRVRTAVTEATHAAKQPDQLVVEGKAIADMVERFFIQPVESQTVTAEQIAMAMVGFRAALADVA